LSFFAGFLFYHRQETFLGQLVRPASLVGGALVMLGGSLFKGFWQRGLVFDAPDVEFLFTSPFTQRQIVVYRLLPSYGFALAQAVVFLALLGAHLNYPVLAATGLILFQIACFHVAAGAAIFSGTLSETAYHRIRWMLLLFYLLLTVLYLRTAWDVKLIPSFVSSPLAQILFYPALTLSDIGTAPSVGRWSLALARSHAFSTAGLWPQAFWLALVAGSAAGSLWLLLRLKADIFEASLGTTTRVAEKRLRIRQGRSLTVAAEMQRSPARLPRGAVFRGVGAVVWKNLVVASRSRREMVLASVFTLIYVGFLIALRWLLFREMSQGGQLPAREVMDFDKLIGGMLCLLVFLLQRAFPFDFRRDGAHLVGFRTFPFSPFALALAELAVPTIFCLAFQAAGIAGLMICGSFGWTMSLLLLLGCPAVALGLNGIWNLHYLLAAAKRAGGKADSASPVALLMVVTLSFLIFYPAGWTALQVGRHTIGSLGEAPAIAAWLAVQYAVDFILVLLLARLFQHFEVSRDS